MKILKNRVVSITYRVTADDGRVLDQVLSDQPVVAVQGSGTLLAEVETHIEGLRPGQSVTFLLHDAPTCADTDLRPVEVPLAQMPADVMAKPGAAVGAIAGAGVTPLWIREINADRVVLDPSSSGWAGPRTVQIWILDVAESVDEP